VLNPEGAGPTSAGYTIVVDTTNNQTATIVSVTDNVTPAVGNVRDGGTTNDATPVLAGRLSAVLAPGEELQILRNDNVVGSASQVNGTSWTFTDRLPGNGDYDYTVRVVDAAGNVGRESAIYDIRAELPRVSAQGAGGSAVAALDPEAPDPVVKQDMPVTLAELLESSAPAFAAGSAPALIGSSGSAHSLDDLPSTAGLLWVSGPSSSPLDQLLSS